MIFKKRKTFSKRKKKQIFKFVIKNFKFFVFLFFAVIVFFFLLIYNIFLYLDFKNIDTKYKEVLKEKGDNLKKNQKIKKQLDFLNTKVGQQGVVLEFAPKSRPGEKIVEIID